MGTFTLLLCGLGTGVLAGGEVGAIGGALAGGIALLILVYLIGPISGCHLNPAVTLGLVVARRIEPKHAVRYVVAQCLGAIVAAATVWLIADTRPGGHSPKTDGLGANGYGAHSPGGYDVGGVFLIEVLLTALLVFTVLRATDPSAPQGFAGIMIGFVLIVIHLVSIPVDNTSVNPARSLAPALFVGDWAISQLWVFIVAPLLGGLLAAVLHLALLEPDKAVVEPPAAVPAPRSGAGARMSRSHRRRAAELGQLSPSTMERSSRFE